MNHNGGHITFGPDGYLYIPLGDGGGSNDRGEGHNPEIGNAQDTMSLHGKILPSTWTAGATERSTASPEDNPFVNGGGLPEIYAYGLRNPYHIAFDAGGEHRLFAGDAGQVQWEEIDIIERGATTAGTSRRAAITSTEAITPPASWPWSRPRSSSIRSWNTRTSPTGWGAWERW
jgi:glucose/arabinose dehydrogenase